MLLGVSAFWFYMRQLKILNLNISCDIDPACGSGAGLVKKKGFKGSFAEAGSSAKVESL